jgi:hypothetical protein
MVAAGTSKRSRCRGAGCLVTMGRSGRELTASAWLNSHCSVVKVPSCRMIVRYGGLHFGLQFAFDRTHSQTYVARCDLHGGLMRTNAYPPWSSF